MAEYIECRSCDSRSCEGCNIHTLATMLHRGKLDSLMGMHRSINPNADVAPVVHGWWEWFEEWSQSTPEHLAECDDCGWRCGKCKTALEDIVGGYWDNPEEEPKLTFCPNCGCRMDAEVSE